MILNVMRLMFIRKLLLEWKSLWCFALAGLRFEFRNLPVIITEDCLAFTYVCLFEGIPYGLYNKTWPLLIHLANCSHIFSHSVYRIWANYIGLWKYTIRSNPSWNWQPKDIHFSFVLQLLFRGSDRHKSLVSFLDNVVLYWWKHSQSPRWESSPYWRG
jgi:hypothetical protein